MERDTLPLITVSGPPASGTSTLTTTLSESLDFELINGGDIFRELAAEKDLSLAELTELSEEDDSIDRELDARLADIIEAHATGERTPDGNGLIIESRLAGWHGFGYTDMAVFLTASQKTRYNRTEGRVETLEELKRREKSEADRYMKYYGADMYEMELYDVILNTERFTPDMVFEIVKSGVEQIES